MADLSNATLESLEAAAGWIAAAERVTVLTGAGISTDSGIPDFRGPNGLWTKNPAAEKMATIQNYLADPETRKLAWQNRLTMPAWTAEPNAGHLAIVELERQGKLHALVTQNIDELHQRAGTDPAKVVEVHGTVWWTRCWECRDRRPMREALDRVVAGEADPPCLVCGGIIKSDTISFGQALVPDVIDRAMQVSGECDVLLAIGSTLAVYPVAHCVPLAKSAGAKVVIVNLEETAMDGLADAKLTAPISDVLPGPGSQYPTHGVGFSMATFRDLLSAAKSSIAEIDTTTAAERIAGGSLVLDVREPDEYNEGAIPGAIHIPRGHLESQIEGRITDKDAPVVVYCAGGVRSAFAVQTMQELGYTGAASMDGGFGRWKDEGRPWKQPASLTAEQNNRYKRHLLLPEVGVAGQVKLLESKVLLLGAGGLGSPAAMYLAAAGVGTIGIVDMDEVDASNLQRQILHNVDRIGDRKVDSAKKTLTALNPDVDVVTYDTRLSAENIIDILKDYDLVVDGADNFPSRYLLNDASVKLGIPVVHGSIFRFEGMVSVFHPLEGPTYRDMVPEPPPAELAPSCAEAGVLGVLPGIVGSIQALEAIKVLLGLGDPLIGRILSIDTTEMEFRVFNLKPDPANRVTYANRDQIQIRDLDGLCAPWIDDH